MIKNKIYFEKFLIQFRNKDLYPELDPLYRIWILTSPDPILPTTGRSKGKVIKEEKEFCERGRLIRSLRLRHSLVLFGQGAIHR